MSHVVRHIPHSSLVIPKAHREPFLLCDEELEFELLQMTDRYTDELFDDLPGVAVTFPVSRLLVDVERFEDDHLEPMSSRGMGALYRQTHDQRPLRRALSAEERKCLLHQFYRPHHQALEAAVETALQAHGRALLIDCHSFPSRALPYEMFDHQTRPEIGIGTDATHTSEALMVKAVMAFAHRGFSVALNKPFPGTITPLKFYGRETRVQSVMIEVRRDLYMDETTGAKLKGFDILKAQIGTAIRELTAG